ncbi:hypothetical protein KR009_005973, partial [Drosophila setifemur]
MPAGSSNSCCGSGSGSSNSCLQDCRCCRQAYEHLPVPRLQHQLPPPPLYQLPQEQPRPQQQQQVSCITTLQQTTTTQQVQQLPVATSDNYTYGTCLLPTTTTSNTYVSNVATVPHCTSHCHGHGSNMQSCNSSSSNMSSCSSIAPAPTPPMIFVPFMMPVQQQQHMQQQQHLHIQPPLPPADDCKPVIQAKSVPPPPQPPPLLTHYVQSPPLPQPPLPLLPPPHIACPPPTRAPATPPPSAPRCVQSLKSAAAAAVSVYQRVSSEE